jgi:thiol-disulfide isomerase/thioredoxin
MKLLSKITILGLIAILLMGMAISLAKQQSSTQKSLLKVGDLFPVISLEGILTAAEQKYLGIPESKSFILEDIPAEIIIVEFFNKYCPHCQQQAPILNELYDSIQSDALLRSKVKMLGIGNGNSQLQLNAFRGQKNIPFPLFPDAQFIIHDEIGKPRTPFIVVIKKAADGKMFVGKTFLGLISSKDTFLNAIKKLVASDVSVAENAELKSIIDDTKSTSEKLKEQVFIALIKKTINANMLSYKRILIDKNDILYQVQLRTEEGKKVLFIRKIYRPTVCDVCHDVHFWYSFDSNGTITHFFPIYLTKAYNQEWTEKDLQMFNQRIINRSITESFEFNPEMDAVTSATITSSLIFDTMNKSNNLFKLLKEKQIIK